MAKVSLQAAVDVVDTSSYSLATVSSCNETWLQSSGFPKEIQTTIQDLPFNEDKLFSAKTDKSLHSLKESRVTLWSRDLHPITLWKATETTFLTMLLRIIPGHRQRPQSQCPGPQPPLLQFHGINQRHSFDMHVETFDPHVTTLSHSPPLGAILPYLSTIGARSPQIIGY